MVFTILNTLWSVHFNWIVNCSFFLIAKVFNYLKMEMGMNNLPVFPKIKCLIENGEHTCAFRGFHVFSVSNNFCVAWQPCYQPCIQLPPVTQNTYTVSIAISKLSIMNREKQKHLPYKYHLNIERTIVSNNELNPDKSVCLHLICGIEIVENN